MGVEGHAQHEAAGVGELNELLPFDVDPVDLSRLAARIGIAVEPPGYALRVIQAINEHRYLRVIVQKTHSSSTGIQTTRTLCLFPARTGLVRLLVLQHEAVVEESAVYRDGRSADVR